MNFHSDRINATAWAAMLLATLTAVLATDRAHDAAAASPATAPAAATLKSNQASKRNQGSAAVLRGRVCIYNIFVSDAESAWSKDKENQVSRRMAEALEFLGDHAADYKVSVEFVQVSVKADSKTLVPTDMFQRRGWLAQAIKTAAGMDPNDLVLSLKKQHRAEQVAVVVHVNKSGTSYNLSWSGLVQPPHACEEAVMFDRYPSKEPTAAASYAHEILHLFGAGELYFPFDQDDVRKKAAAKLWPTDIMRMVGYEIKKLTLGEFTAYRIGWMETLKPEHRTFEDEG
ncbi:MAG: hypothetical protein ABFD92_03475 [Planctomycetaceae bacterium]|nr:hypothetical protein [Planctomycetaceae bacterium]